MVTLLCFLRRKDGTTEQEFVEHWLTRHGPLVRDTPEVARHVERYEQYRPSASPAAAGLGTAGFDGVTVMTFPSAEAFVAFMGEPAYAEVVHPDEDRFLDRDGLVWMVADEPRVVIDGRGRP